MKFWQTIITIGLILNLLPTACLPSTPAECQSLSIPINSSRPVLLTDHGSAITTDIDSSGNVLIDFTNNGQEGAYSGVVFLTPALNVRGCTHLDIRGTSTEDFTLVVQYKKQKGKTVAETGYSTFPSTSETQTIIVPLEYDGTVDEIALMFFDKSDASMVTLVSINLK